jgi:replicative DNA helicase
MADSNLATFRKLADTGDIPILLISSFNRDSYHSPVSLKSYKESGGIEYSADTLIGIQLRNIGCKGFDINKAMRQPVRDLELVILKQRYGELGDLPIFFNPSANIFSDLYDDVSPASSENVY